MPKNASHATPSRREVDRLREAIHLLIRALLISGRAGAPAEGKLPFNPLYFHMLGVLKEQECMRPSDLAFLLRVPRSTLSTASKALQSRGLIAQSPDPADGRAQILSLTVDGANFADAIKRQDLKNMKMLLSMVDAKRRGVMIDVLEEISIQLNEYK